MALVFNRLTPHKHNFSTAGLYEARVAMKIKI